MVPPVLGLVKFTAAVAVLLHTTWLAGWLTDAVGFTVMVNVTGVPVHVTPALVYDGVTTIVATAGAVPAFTPTKEAMLPLPDATGKPIVVLELVQL